MLQTNISVSIARMGVPPILSAVQGDTGRNVAITLSDYSIPAGATATVYVAKPSGEAVYNNCEISDGKIIVELTAQMLAETGENDMQVRIMLNGEVVTSFGIILRVAKFFGEDAIESGSETNIFDQWIENAKEEISEVIDTTLTQSAKAADAKTVGDFFKLLVPAWKPNSLYEAGDYVQYNNMIYVRLNDIQGTFGPEYFDSNNWSNVLGLNQRMMEYLQGMTAHHFVYNDRYYVGDYVIYFNTLYRCIRDYIPTGDSSVDGFKSDYFEEVRITDELTNLKADLSVTAKVATPEETKADLYICDDHGNVISEFVDGHIVTKNFDSSSLSAKFAEKINIQQDASDAGKALVIDSEGTIIPSDVSVDVDDTLTQEGEAADAKAVGDALGELESQISSIDGVKIANALDSAADLDITDYFGNVVARFGNGHIKTKEFDSSNLEYSSLKGKKWTCIGDSLTEVNVRTTLHYHDYVSESTGITVVNHGHSGAGYYARSWDYAFRNEVQRIPTDSDVITIFGSINDVFNTTPIPLGDVTDATASTLCGCINITIDNLYVRIPAAYLGIVTPTPCWYQESGSVDDWTPSNPGNDLELYAEALVEICKRRSIPCLDLYHSSNLRPQESSFRTLAFSKDGGNGIHPNETGHKLIAARFLEFIRTLIL